MDNDEVSKGSYPTRQIKIRTQTEGHNIAPQTQTLVAAMVPNSTTYVPDSLEASSMAGIAREIEMLFKGVEGTRVAERSIFGTSRPCNSEPGVSSGYPPL